jgi:hypothetical protein
MGLRNFESQCGLANLAGPQQYHSGGALQCLLDLCELESSKHPSYYYIMMFDLQ